MKNNNGFSIAELMVAVAIGGIVSLVMATFFTFATEQFYSLIDQNEAEQSILLSSYYLRSVVAQAVKTMSGDPAGFTGAPDSTTYPSGTAVGFLDTSRQCTDASCITMTNNWPVGWPAGNITPFAYFIRENGGGTVAAPTSSYVMTGIFFIPPLATTAGKLYIGQLPAAGGTFIKTDLSMSSQFYFDRIEAFGLSYAVGPNTSYALGTPVPAPPSLPVGTPVISVSLFLRARYFKGMGSVKDYSSDPNVAAAAGANFVDITSTINVALRDNVIGPNLTGTGLNERPNNGLYFYHFVTPSLENF